MFNYSFKIVLRGDHVRKDGTQMLVLQAFLCGARVRISLNMFVRREHYDPVRMVVRMKGEAERAQKINALLAKVKSRVEDMFFDSMLNDVVLTPAQFEKEFDRKPAHGDFLVWMQQQMAEARATGMAPATLKNYVTTFRWLGKFRSKILFGDLTYEFVREWDVFLKKQKLDGNTTAKYHRVLRKFVLLAKKKGKRIVSPYDDFKFKEVSKERVYLNAAEVTALRALYDNRVLKHHQQVTLRHFLFQIGTSLRYSDLAVMSKDSIVGDMLVFTPMKTKRTGKIVKVPLSEMALDMLRDSESETDRLFRVNKEQVMNRFLKEVSDFAGLGKKLTTHVGRHTFGYLFIAAGGQVEVLQKIMGHNSIHTTMIYTHIDTRQIQAGVKQLNVLLRTAAEEED